MVVGAASHFAVASTTLSRTHANVIRTSLRVRVPWQEYDNIRRWIMRPILLITVPVGIVTSSGRLRFL
jgi:hypothetical protein